MNHAFKEDRLVFYQCYNDQAISDQANADFNSKVAFTVPDRAEHKLIFSRAFPILKGHSLDNEADAKKPLGVNAITACYVNIVVTSLHC